MPLAGGKQPHLDPTAHTMSTKMAKARIKPPGSSTANSNAPMVDRGVAQDRPTTSSLAPALAAAKKDRTAAGQENLK